MSSAAATRRSGLVLGWRCHARLLVRAERVQVREIDNHAADPGLRRIVARANAA